MQNKAYIIYILVAFLISSAIAFITTAYMGFATFTLLLLVIGLLYVKISKHIHANIMKIAIIGDLALVLVLELQRSAIETAAGFNLEPLQIMHIIFSTLAMLLYFPTLYYGQKLLKSKKRDPKVFSKHMIVARAAFLFRLLGFILMFSLLTHVKKA
ncbi:MAG: hypothetical protein HOO06_02805 [Bdellovibrionaceae bacterium]|jgi:hypothetical protein|nr:hypothetical protein [Pseudobdellovibrionaceae bacterium]